jgi:hypothetical protein
MRRLGLGWLVLLCACAKGATPCAAGATRCEGLCTDLVSNPEHCGACGAACETGDVCHGGMCRADCPAGLTECDGSCVDTSTSPTSCGGCGFECPGGAVCLSGECVETCPSPRIACDGACVDPQADRFHCGGCGTECGGGLLCSAGECAASCQDELRQCGEVCVDFLSDGRHCGECDHPCDPGNVCVGGACLLACPPGQTDCAGRCVDLTRDRQRCGACGNACLDGEYCEAGACVPTCSPGLTECDGACIDVDNDPENCGDCGNSCGGSGWACLGGTCRDIPLLTFAGVRTNLPIADLGGWEQCYVGTYNLNASLAGVVLAGCDGDNLMLACRLTGGDTLIAAAHAPRDDVLFDTGVGNVAHNANNVGWYYNNSYSWGFARQGDPLSRSSCDTNNTNPTERLCWHTGAGNLNGGWRCGSNTGLNGSVAYERLIYQY